MHAEGIDMQVDANCQVGSLKDGFDVWHGENYRDHCSGI